MRFFRPYFQDLWNIKKNDKEVVTLTKLARVFGFTMHVGGFLNTTNTYNHGWLVEFFLILLLLLLPFSRPNLDSESIFVVFYKTLPLKK